MAPKRKERRFSVVDIFGVVACVYASGKMDVLLRSDSQGCPPKVVVIDGSLRSIGWRGISLLVVRKSIIYDLSDTEMRRGTNYTLIIESFHAIPNAIYLGKAHYKWFVFRKNKTTFWVDKSFVEFSRINGKSV